MSAPVADPNAAPDPSQVFTDPSQMPALQGGQPQAPPEQSDQGEQEPGQQPGYHHDPIDLEGCIAQSIESGCHLADAAQTAEDYQRFAQGVSYLATALKDIQPQQQPPDQHDPGETAYATTLLTTAQRDREGERSAETQLQVAQARAQAQIRAAEIAAEASRHAASASRPPAAQTSTRG
jgi:hypothetical protein